VTAQMARAGRYIPEGSRLMLYIGDAAPPETVAMPDLTGMTPTQAEEALQEAGLYMRATGASSSYSDATKVYSQSQAPGEQVKPGTVITVSFTDTSETEDESAGIG